MPATAAAQLAEVLENFQGRHRNLIDTFEARAAEMEEAFAPHAAFTAEQRRLVGAYFLHEYSFEAAALFNPSIVAHPDQSGAPAGRGAFHPQPSSGGRGARLLAHVSVGIGRGGRQCHHRSVGAVGPCRKSAAGRRARTGSRSS